MRLKDAYKGKQRGSRRRSKRLYTNMLSWLITPLNIGDRISVPSLQLFDIMSQTVTLEQKRGILNLLETITTGQ